MRFLFEGDGSKNSEPEQWHAFKPVRTFLALKHHCWDISAHVRKNNGGRYILSASELGNADVSVRAWQMRNLSFRNDNQEGSSLAKVLLNIS